MLDYDKNKELFVKYIDNCRRRIINAFFNDEEIKHGFVIRNDNIQKGLISDGLSVEEAIKVHRNRLIDIKLNHTMRIVEDVSLMAQRIKTPINFKKVVKISALLHDIARFEQAVYNDSFIDKDAVNMDGMTHALYGHKMLVTNHGFDYYDIPKKYQYAIGEVVKHHQDAILPDDYSKRFENVNKLDTDNFLTGNDILNENEKIIVSALVQMVKDVDMLDILYHHLTDEFDVVRQSQPFKLSDPKNPNRKMTLSEVASRFGVEPNILKEYNNLDNDDLSNINVINIPVKNIEVSSLIVPFDIQERFFKNEVMDLKELQSRQDWTFITGMWWRLNKFLNSITFISNLELVEEKELLNSIYNKYPDSLKPLVFPAFEFAQEKLVEKVLKENKDKIYIQR